MVTLLMALPVDHEGLCDYEKCPTENSWGHSYVSISQEFLLITVCEVPGAQFGLSHLKNFKDLLILYTSVFSAFMCMYIAYMPGTQRPEEVVSPLELELWKAISQRLSTFLMP